MSMNCPECKRLELAVQVSIMEIQAVVKGSFETVDEKLNRLFEKQDIRDKVIRSLYAHKATHYRRDASLSIE